MDLGIVLMEDSHIFQKKGMLHRRVMLTGNHRAAFIIPRRLKDAEREAEERKQTGQNCRKRLDV